MIGKKRKRVLIVDRYNWTQFDYGDVARRLRRDAVVRHFFPSPELYDFSTSDLKPSHEEFVVYETCVELEVFPEEVDVTLPAHGQVVERYIRRSQKFREILNVELEIFRPHLVVFPQGHILESQIARKECIKRQIRFLAIENTFHSQKFVWDNVSGITVNKNLASNFVWRHYDNIDELAAHEYAVQYFTGIRSTKAEEHSSGARQYQRKCSQYLVVFIGQVYTDASLLFGLDGFVNPIEVIRTLVDCSVKLGFRLILKLHPKEMSGNAINDEPYRQLTLRKIKENKDLYKQIEEYGIDIDYTELDTFDLISNADLCVTINSQAGLEALLMKKHVICCGRAFYADLGLADLARNSRELEQRLRGAIAEPNRFSAALNIEKVFYTVVEKYFRDKSNGQLSDLIRSQVFPV